MIEEEAKTKECCGPRQFANSTSEPCMCIASQCMAWRWYDNDSVRVEPRQGYCGLAGQ